MEVYDVVIVCYQAARQRFKQGSFSNTYWSRNKQVPILFVDNVITLVLDVAALGRVIEVSGIRY